MVHKAAPAGGIRSASREGGPPVRGIGGFALRSVLLAGSLLLACAGANAQDATSALSPTQRAGGQEPAHHGRHGRLGCGGDGARRRRLAPAASGRCRRRADTVSPQPRRRPDLPQRRGEPGPGPAAVRHQDLSARLHRRQRGDRPRALPREHRASEILLCRPRRLRRRAAGTSRRRCPISPASSSRSRSMC